MGHGQTYNPKYKPKCLPNETMGFSWDGHTYSMCNTANSLIGSIPKIEFFHWSRQYHQYLGPYTISCNQIFTMHASHIYICHISHILWKNLQAYNIEGTVQEEKEHQFQGASRALGIV